MKYRTKLTLTLLGITGLCVGSSSYFIYQQASKLVFEQMQSKVLGLTASLAPQISGDLHSQIQNRKDEDSTAYRTIAKQLRAARDAARANHIPLRYVYTMGLRPDGKSYFVVDAEENPVTKSHVGDIYEGNLEGINFEHAEVDKQFTIDKWGTWLSASAPILNSRGRPIAALGLDLDANDVLAQLQTVTFFTVLALIFSAVLAVLAAIVLSRILSKPLARIKEAVGLIGKGQLDTRIAMNRKDEFGEVASAINAMAKGLEEREKIKNLFARYVSKDVMDKIVGDDDLTLKGSRKKITCMFSDIREFSTFSENLKPEEVVSVLNEYFEKMIDIIFKYNGTLDKFIGDGMMVVFGAPLEDEDQEDNAVNAALEMQACLDEMRVKWKQEGKHQVKIGIGIHTGNAVVGNIGSSQRMEFTAIGDTVNVAARLESATKEHNVDILVGDSTVEGMKKAVQLREIGPISVKGRKNAVKVFSVSAPQSSQERQSGKKVA